MARTKSRPVTAPDPPPAASKSLVVNATPTTAPSSGSSSTATASTTCPHCKTAFIDLPLKDFRHHVASCTTGAAPANDDSSDSSSLTPPPESPAVAAINNANTITVDATAITGIVAPKVKVEPSGESSVNGTVDQNDPGAQVHPYVTSEFAFYDKVDDREASVATRRNSEEAEESKSSAADPLLEGANEDKADAKPRHRFPKFTSFEVFDEYLGNHEDMSYDDLYQRTAVVADVLVEYQKEWDKIGKEIDDHEAYVKAQAKIAADKSKAIEEEKTKVDDEKYLQIAQQYKAQLKLSRSDWDRWLEEQQDLYPDQSDVHECLRNLRNPTFLMAIHKRQKVSHADSLKLANRPILQDRITKEEIAAEKRKRYGRLVDQVTFDDMKFADAYGFNYSAQPHHVGNQPLPSLNDKSKARGTAADEGRGGRSQRALTKRSYDAENSGTPTSDEEELLPAKRARKVRNLDAGLDFQARTRNGPQSRGGTPPIRVFPSGKRVGRPPAKSKLKEVQQAPPSTSPTLENGTAPRKLAPKQEELLHESVENLVNQTHPLRRPRIKSGDTGETSRSPSEASSRPSTSSSLREPKRPTLESHNTEPDTLIVEGPSSQIPLAPPVAAKSRKRKSKEEDIDESKLTPEEREALYKKREKSRKLSESLRKRWQKGDMKGAMESRKATNAKKKAAKLEAKRVAEGQAIAGGYSQPIVLPMERAPDITQKSFTLHPYSEQIIVPEQYQLQNLYQHPPPPVQIQQHPIHPPPPPPMPPQYQYQSQSQPDTPIATPPHLPSQQPARRKPPKPSPSRKNSGKGKAKSTGVSPAQASSPVPVARELGKRKRRPTRLALDDDDDGADEQLVSEYDRYQQISNSQPGSPDIPWGKGKRARKSRFDISGLVDDGEEEDGSDEYYSS